ncbi:hypothetical protein DSLASN_45220 [Desulfoluna limicola]|uniref:Glycosyltransferase n=1 Tax=Desulfoluna limicola TaxID=2810562 RepID=A0ABM7PMY4_9BACT|nr:TIGR04282 family arsenosugar biosynthesis glycosyltransferase [Desulfoluna limicola]BCS98890.1 hypothetical protein DSLASN_45220 [Desulfoluna limicola]
MPLLILFVKVPEYGRVKTRLATAVGQEMALALYKHFVETTLARLAPFTPLRIEYTPEKKEGFLGPWLTGPHEVQSQKGEDLGKRMSHALTRAFEDGHRKAVIVGGDAPDLPVRLVHEAFEALESSDTVFVPVSDGGYCLVGARKGALFAPMFEGMRWSHSHVMEETVKRAKAHKISVRLLSGWHDIDTPEDFLAFVKRNEHTPEFPSLYTKAARLISDGGGWPHVDEHGHADAGEAPCP